MMQMPQALIEQLTFVGQRKRRRGSMYGRQHWRGISGRGSCSSDCCRHCAINGTQAGSVPHSAGAQQVIA